MPSSPSFSPILKNLTYIHEKPLNRKTEFGGSDFGGYPTLKQRRRSFNIKGTMSVHCGYVYLLSSCPFDKKNILLSACHVFYMWTNLTILFLTKICQRTSTWKGNRIWYQRERSSWNEAVSRDSCFFNSIWSFFDAPPVILVPFLVSHGIWWRSSSTLFQMLLTMWRALAILVNTPSKRFASSCLLMRRPNQAWREIKGLIEPPRK